MSIASYLNANGHNAVICERFFTDKTPEEIITENNPDIIGISIVANQYLQDSIEISEAAKKFGISKSTFCKLFSLAPLITILSIYITYFLKS